MRHQIIHIREKVPTLTSPARAATAAAAAASACCRAGPPSTFQVPASKGTGGMDEVRVDTFSNMDDLVPHFPCSNRVTRE